MNFLINLETFLELNPKSQKYISLYIFPNLVHFILIT
jgi:hypothetical protein